jgi:HK97 family phage portal protein
VIPLAEKRSLFNMVFGNKPVSQPKDVTTLRMLNGFAPIFTSTSTDAYDSDIVRSAVDAIARNAAKLRPKHVRRKDGQVQLTESNLERLLAVRPNPHMDAYSFLYKVVTQLYMKNNSFIFIDWDSTGGVRALYPINAPTVQLMESKGEIFAKFMFLGGQQIVLPYSDLIHLRRFFYSNDLYGETSERALMPTLDLIHTTDEGIKNAVKSSAYLRGLLKFSNMLKPEDMKRQRDLFISDYMDITNNGGIAATDAKADYIELKNDPKMVDEKVMQAAKTKVFNYFGVNESIIKSDYSEDQWNAFYESTIEPIAIQLSLEFTSKLFTSKEQGYGNEIIFESNRLQYASNKTKVEVVTMLVDRGMMSLNQGLEVFNLPPIEGGEKRIVSLNFVDSELANQYQLGLKKNEGSGTDGTDQKG